MKRHWLKIVAAVFAILLLAVLLIPLFVNANTFRPTLENQLSQALGRKVTLGNLSFSIFSGSLVADNISIADDPAFSTKPFIEAKSLHIGVETGPLIFHRQLIVTSFVADSPAINLVHAENGTWNYSSMGRTATSRTQAQQQESAFPNFTVGEIKIQNGSATVSSLPPSGQPIVYSKLNFSAQQFSFSKYFPFQLSASLPGDGSLKGDGTAGPINQKDASDTPFNVKINLKHFDPVASGVLQPSEGISMLGDIAAQATSDGQTVASNGTVHADRLKLVANGSPTPRPVDITYTIHHNLDSRTGKIDSLKINTGAVAVQTNGTYQITGPRTMLSLHVSAPNLPIDQVEALLPAAGVRLPSGSKLQGGTLTANLNVTGPANAPTISGPVQVDNTRLAGFDLGSKIGGLKPVSGSQGGTPIQTMRANVNSSPAGTRIDNLYIAVPSLGTAAGAGTVSPAGGLNFHVVAKLNPGAGVAGQALGGLTAVSGSVGQTITSVAANGIPINITGTTANPVIQADLSSIVKQNAGNIIQQQLQQRLGNKQQGNPADLLNKFIPH
ncbi:MAG TPA: AsmA family protein [Acidobacteriaceae bacterium]